jgi:hypothetical protein
LHDMTKKVDKMRKELDEYKKDKVSQ